MNALINGTTSLQRCFGIRTEPIGTSNEPLKTISIPNDIYNSIMTELSASFGGNTALKFSATPESYLRYKDGNYSSMIKEVSKGIKTHSGFESINLIELADNIYKNINTRISNTILVNYNEKLLMIFNEMAARKDKEMSDIIISEHLSEISAYKLFYEDLQDDFENIMINPVRRLSYLSSVVNKKSDIYKNFDFIINRLENLGTHLNYMKYIPTNEEIVNLLLNSRFLIDLNLYNGIYEYVLSGDYSKNYEQKILKRCKQMESKLRDIFSLLKSNLNSTYNWGTIFLPYANSNGFYVTQRINEFQADRLQFNYELLETLQNKISNCMNNIQLIPENDKETL